MRDGKPCRACNNLKTMTKFSKQIGKKSSAEKTTQPINDIGTTQRQEASETWRRNNCPADVETLGRSTWTLLHTMAAYYPIKPVEEEKTSMKQFIESFAQHYPCWFCKEDFQKEMAKEPVDVSNRDTLSQWLCRRHNQVNVKLNKPVFDCTKIFERWLQGPLNGKCD
ncbi:FAD-linked sulfhydryl oxidase ALR [Spinellus fusiger]|nr:FAD-linked sulfhydryl oxidase ALR [Spinellus fusiger]